MSKVWKVFAQSSEPEAYLKYARQTTKNTKQDKMWVMHIQILQIKLINWKKNIYNEIYINQASTRCKKLGDIIWAI